MAKHQQLVRAQVSIKPLLFEIILLCQQPYGATRGVALRDEGRIDKRSSDPTIHKMMDSVQKDFFDKLTRLIKLDGSIETKIPDFSKDKLYFVDYVIRNDYISVGFSVYRSTKGKQTSEEISYGFTFLFVQSTA